VEKLGRGLAVSRCGVEFSQCAVGHPDDDVLLTCLLAHESLVMATTPVPRRCWPANRSCAFVAGRFSRLTGVDHERATHQFAAMQHPAIRPARTAGTHVRVWQVPTKLQYRGGGRA
jgi:hypothetical protein